MLLHPHSSSSGRLKLCREAGGVRHCVAASRSDSIPRPSSPGRCCVFLPVERRRSAPSALALDADVAQRLPRLMPPANPVQHGQALSVECITWRQHVEMRSARAAGASRSPTSLVRQRGHRHRETKPPKRSFCRCSGKPSQYCPHSCATSRSQLPARHQPCPRRARAPARPQARHASFSRLSSRTTLAGIRSTTSVTVPDAVLGCRLGHGRSASGRETFSGPPQLRRRRLPRRRLRRRLLRLRRLQHFSTPRHFSAASAFASSASCSPQLVQQQQQLRAEMPSSSSSATPPRQPLLQLPFRRHQLAPARATACATDSSVPPSTSSFSAPPSPASRCAAGPPAPPRCPLLGSHPAHAFIIVRARGDPSTPRRKRCAAQATRPGPGLPGGERPPWSAMPSSSIASSSASSSTCSPRAAPAREVKCRSSRCARW